MQRLEHESFEKYKARRAASNLAVKNLNRPTRVLPWAATPARRLSFSTGIKGMASSNNTQYGDAIRMQFAKRQATLVRRMKHRQHVAHMQNKRNARRALAAAPF